MKGLTRTVTNCNANERSGTRVTCLYKEHDYFRIQKLNCDFQHNHEQFEPCFEKNRRNTYLTNII